jgi:hypothetical protein
MSAVHVVEMWLAGGPADGRCQLVETDQTGGLPTTVVLPQTGAFIGADDDPAPRIDHVYRAPTTSAASRSTATTHRGPPHHPDSLAWPTTHLRAVVDVEEDRKGRQPLSRSAGRQQRGRVSPHALGSPWHVASTLHLSC